MSWELSLAGLAVGALVGLTGMGGGSLMTPILVLLFGFKPTVAIGTDILHGAVFKSVGALRHRQLGTVHGRLSGWMLVTSAPMSLVGVATSMLLERTYGDGVQVVGARVLGAALVAGGVGLLAKGFVRRTDRPDVAFRLTRRDRVAALAIGFFGGFIVGLTSVGTGVFFGLTLLIAFPLHSAKVVGTDVFHAAALLWVAGAGHLAAGNVDLSAMGWLLLGSIPGVLLGSQVSISLPDRLLTIVLSTVLLLAGAELAGLPAPLLPALVVAVAAAAVASAVRARTRAARGAAPAPARRAEPLRVGRGR
jgi:uncharacterized membrane protein YfcA